MAPPHFSTLVGRRPACEPCAAAWVAALRRPLSRVKPPVSSYRELWGWNCRAIALSWNVLVLDSGCVCLMNSQMSWRRPFSSAWVRGNSCRGSSETIPATSRSFPAQLKRKGEVVYRKTLFYRLSVNSKSVLTRHLPKARYRVPPSPEIRLQSRLRSQPVGSRSAECALRHLGEVGEPSVIQGRSIIPLPLAKH